MYVGTQSNGYHAAARMAREWGMVQIACELGGGFLALNFLDGDFGLAVPQPGKGR
jgi:hypothetical protein